MNDNNCIVCLAKENVIFNKYYSICKVCNSKLKYTSDDIPSEYRFNKDYYLRMLDEVMNNRLVYNKTIDGQHYQLRRLLKIATSFQNNFDSDEFIIKLNDVSIVFHKNKPNNISQLEVKENIEKKEPINMNNIIDNIEILIKEHINNLSNFSDEITGLKIELEKQETIKKEISKTNIGNIKALKVFNNIEDFNFFTENLYNIKTWTIRPELYKDRAEILKKYKYWHELKSLFNDSNLTNKNINDDQLVSYFDTMYIMYNIFKEINQQNIKDEMRIIMEYRIPTPNKNRIDYVLIYRNNIFLLEFGKSENFNSLNNDFNKKNTQLEGYKNSLINVLNEDNIKISSYVCVYLDESTDENINSNNETFDLLKRTINKTFGKIKNAFECLQEAE